MIKNFNTILSKNSIIRAYKTNQFPNAYCLLWNQENNIEILSTEQNNSLTTERRKEIALDGNTNS